MRAREHAFFAVPVAVVTVEFTLPDGLVDDLKVGPDGPWCVPIAVLGKRPLRNFDLREDGMAVPVLGQAHNGPVAGELLFGAAILAGVSADLLDRLTPALQVIAEEAPDVAGRVLQGLVERREAEPEIAVAASRRAGPNAEEHGDLH